MYTTSPAHGLLVATSDTHAFAMKMKQLQSMLEDLEVFRDPQIELEQYPTGAHLAACMLYTALGDGHIEDQVRASRARQPWRTVYARVRSSARS